MYAGHHIEVTEHVTAHRQSLYINLMDLQRGHVDKIMDTQLHKKFVVMTFYFSDCSTGAVVRAQL